MLLISTRIMATMICIQWGTNTYNICIRKWDKIGKLSIVTQEHQRRVTMHFLQYTLRKHISNLDHFHLPNHYLIFTSHVKKFSYLIYSSTTKSSPFTWINKELPTHIIHFLLLKTVNKGNIIFIIENFALVVLKTLRKTWGKGKKRLQVIAAMDHLANNIAKATLCHTKRKKLFFFFSPIRKNELFIRPSVSHIWVLQVLTWNALLSEFPTICSTVTCLHLTWKYSYNCQYY